MERVEEAMSSVRGVLKEARRAVSTMVERGDYGAAIEALSAMVEKAFSELGEALVNAVKELRDNVSALRERMEKLTVNVDRLTANLEREVELRRGLEGRVGRVEGRIIEFGLGERLARWCEDYGLKFGVLPRDPFRVDGVIEGEHVIALVEIAKLGSEEDVEQLLEGARIYRERMGEEPSALVLYVYARRPPEELVRLCERHGVIVDNSPRRIARRLAELDRELGRRTG